MKTKKALIFDMDGVVLDSHDAWLFMFNKALEDLENRSIDEKEFNKCVWAKSFNKVCKQYFKVPQSDVVENYYKTYPEFEKRIKPMINADETLKKLKQKGLSIALASNTPKKMIKQALSHVKLIQYFDIILGADCVKNGKPAPDIIFEALKKLNIKKQYAIFVGDTIWDKLAAEAADIEFIGFQIDSETRIDNLKDLLEMV